MDGEGLRLVSGDWKARISELDVATADGRRFFRISTAPLRRATGHGVVTVARDAIVTRLAGALQPGAIEHGVRVAAVDVDAASGCGVVTDAADAASEGDVVVGADGVRSTVRAACPGLPAILGTGWATWEGMTRVVPALAEGTTGRYFVGGDVLSCYPHTHLPLTGVWGRGPITLLGDATHAFPPSQAQGANQAIKDAWSLTRALSETDDVPTAVASRLYVTALRSYSSVLDDERP